MTVTPQMGEYTGLGKWLGMVEAPKTYSIVSGVAALFENNPALGAVVFLFSILFPLAKLILLRAALKKPRPHRARLVAGLSKYSMVDVFVIALLIVASKSLPGGTTIAVRWGAFAFGAAALMTIPVALGLPATTMTKAENRVDS